MFDLSIAWLTSLMAFVAASPAPAPLLEEQLLGRATSVLARVADTPRPAIPQSVLERTRAIVVVPGTRAARPLGERRSMTGVMSARGATLERWSPPAIVELHGTFATTFDTDKLDVIVMAQTVRGLNALMADDEWLPGSVVIAPGPIHDGDAVDADLVAYAHFEKYFAGVGISDWTIESDIEANAVLYGNRYSTEAIVRGRGFFQLRPAARAWRETLAGLFGRIS